MRVRSQAEIDGPNVQVCIEQEPGSAGVIAMDHYARHVLQGRDFRGVRSTGSKAERARPLAAAISNGLVSLRSEAPWVRDLTNEMRSFPLGTHDDQVDGLVRRHDRFDPAGSRSIGAAEEPGAALRGCLSQVRAG